MKPISDAMGRPLRDLRLSVTDRCNFRCRYCMPEEKYGADYPFLPRDQLLTFEELTRLTRLFASLGVEKVRITGGEPLLRKNLPDLIRMLAEIEGISDLALTTNGVLLKTHATALHQAGLKRINVSLDTLNEETFHRLNSRHHRVSQVLEGIEAAAAAGLQVKVNVVVIKGTNDHEIAQIARHFRDTPHTVRFIEFMDVGNSNDWALSQVVPKQEIVKRIAAELPVEEVPPRYFGEVATRYRYQGTDREFGVISSITEPFCSSCTRVRLSSEGKLYTCLFASTGYDVRKLLRSDAGDEEIMAYLIRLWQQRRDRYSDERLTTGQTDRQKIEMSYIGG
ncbi:GTP 3',8-cyclase MoaA [Laceyella putida]|uniref:GTP 3',8-cyclase n=1 Tax=Laceyella putida TaxID=110101 RepID=A0ABW2RLZ6_9BACL